MRSVSLHTSCRNGARDANALLNCPRWEFPHWCEFFQWPFRYTRSVIRSWAAAAILVGLVAAPALRTWCEIECAASDERPVSAASHCHESDASAAPLAVHPPDECGEHAPELAVVSALKVQRAGASPLSVASAFVTPSSAPALQSRAIHSVNQRGSTSPPLLPGTGILRI